MAAGRLLMCTPSGPGAPLEPEAFVCQRLAPPSRLSTERYHTGFGMAIQRGIAIIERRVSKLDENKFRQTCHIEISDHVIIQIHY